MADISFRKFDKLEYLAEEIQEIYSSMHKEVQLLDIERVQLREKLSVYAEELNDYDKMVAKTKGENRTYRSQVEQLKKRTSFASNQEDLQNKVERLEK